MSPQCHDCDIFVLIGRGVTTEISVSQYCIDKGYPEKVYLCAKHGDAIEFFKTYPWYAGHRIV